MKSCLKWFCIHEHKIVSKHVLSAIEGLEPITFGFDTKGLDCRATNKKTTFGDIRQRQKKHFEPIEKNRSRSFFCFLWRKVEKYCFLTTSFSFKRGNYEVPRFRKAVLIATLITRIRTHDWRKKIQPQSNDAVLTILCSYSLFSPRQLSLVYICISLNSLHE